MKVFVYGSLMKKYWNHRFLMEQQYLGTGILEGYEMYHVSSFPGIIRKDEESIQGEVYEVDEKTLRRLDQLESEGTMYIRVEEEIVINNQEKVRAFVYVWNRGIAGRKKVLQMPWEPQKYGG